MTYPDGVYDTFTHLCKWCGETCRVEGGVAVPHRCVIVIS